MSTSPSPKPKNPQNDDAKDKAGAVPLVVPGGRVSAGEAKAEVPAAKPAKPKVPATTPAKAKVPATKPAKPKVPATTPAKPKVAPAPVKPSVSPSRFRFRHLMVLASFLLLVAGPIAVSAWYLWNRAADEYASYVGFSVRTEDTSSSLNLLLGPLGMGGGQTPDSDILYEFIQSQDLVARVDAQLDLRAMWSKPGRTDPVFAYHAPGTIEDLRDYWRRMVHISFDSAVGLIELRVQAFTPDDAQAIARAVTRESTRLINDISLTAREDAIRYAREDLESAVARLKKARGALTAFRNRTQIVDPSLGVASQSVLLAELNTQLAEALIDFDMLQETTREGDPRIAQVERRIKVIEQRIEGERRKLGIGGGSDDADAEVFASLVGEYESLVVDKEFAEQTYAAALTSYDAAQADAQRQSRYLAVHLQPTLAEAAEYPKRVTLLSFIALFSFLVWSVLVLVGYSLRDRR